MKRKPEDARDPSGFKMPRRGVDNSLNDCGEVRPWEQRPGMILEVKMRNFMCHQVFQEVNDRDSEQEHKRSFKCSLLIDQYLSQISKALYGFSLLLCYLPLTFVRPIHKKCFTKSHSS